MMEKLNKAKGDNYSIAVNTVTYNKKEFNKIKKDLNKYSVIFISHEKYKVLSAANAIVWRNLLAFLPFM